MSQQENGVDGARFQKTSQQFGYRYAHLGAGMEEPLFGGVMGVQSLSCGIDLCSSDLVSLVDSEHEGVLERSYTIAINFDAERTETEFGERGKFVLAPGGGAVVASADAVRMANRIKQGMRSRCLLMQVRPDGFADDNIAEEIHAALRETAIIDLDLCLRTQHLARELANPTYSGAVGRLLTESAALELLARTLMAKGADTPAAPSPVSGADYARLTIVRDLIVAHPSRDFSLPELAKEEGMSLSALKAKFPQIFGKTVFAFIADIRLERARDLIRYEGWSIAKAAHHAGYNHQASFTAAFKRRFGTPPSSLKRK